MSWIKKDRSVSGQTVVKESVAADNLSCVKDEFDMASASPEHLPTQRSVRDYVRTYANAPVIEGNQQIPTDAYIAGLLQANNIRIKQGESILYLYVVNGKVIDSRSVRLEDRSFTITETQSTEIDVANGITNYMSNIDRQGEAAFNPSVWILTSGVTKTAEKDAVVINGGLNDYVASWTGIVLEVGTTYTISGNVTATDGTGCNSRVYSAFPLNVLSESHIGQTTGVFTHNFVALAENHVIGLSGLAGSNLTVKDFAVKKNLTEKIVRYEIRLPYPATFKFETTSSLEANLATTVATIGGVNLNANTTSSETTEPLVIEYKRSAIGRSRQNIKITGVMEEQVTVNGEQVTITNEVVKSFSLYVQV